MDGNLPAQQPTQSEYPSDGQDPTQEAKSTPSSPPVQDWTTPQRIVHSRTQTSNTVAGEVGHDFTQALNEPPGQSPLGDGEGVGVAGVGVGAGTGVGAGPETVPLVTQPPQSSSRGDPTTLFNQHSLVACTQVNPTQPEAAAHWLQQSSALLALPPEPKFVPSLFMPTNIRHCPGGGVGVGGPGVGGLQVGGEGPNLMPRGACTTTLVTAKLPPLSSPTDTDSLRPMEAAIPAEAPAASGVHPNHCVDTIAAPRLFIICTM